MPKENSNEAGLVVHAVIHGISSWPSWVWILLAICAVANISGMARPRGRRR